MTNYLLIYDLPVGTPVDRYTKIHEAVDKIGGAKVAYSTYHVPYDGNLELYLSPFFTREDRVMIAPYDPYATKLQKGKEASEVWLPYQSANLNGAGLSGLGLLAGLWDQSPPTPMPLNALAAFYSTSFKSTGDKSWWE